MNQKTRRRDERTGSDDEHPDAINGRADDFHELSKIFHELLSCRKAHSLSILFVSGKTVATNSPPDESVRCADLWPAPSPIPIQRRKHRRPIGPSLQLGCRG